MYSTNINYISQRGFEEFIAKDQSIDIITKSARVTFDIEIESRNWGIKSILLMVVNLEVSIEWKDSDGNRHEYNHTFTEVESDKTIDGGVITYDDCDIDFEKMTASVS